MEQDTLKSAWQDVVTMPKTNTEIKSMIREDSHPVLKRMRKQFIIECAGFSLFLFVYYDFFDGDRKPFYLNVLLVTALLVVIMHNIIGYMLTMRGAKGNNIKQSLEDHLFKMKAYAVVSIVSRVLVAGCLLFFFTSVITFNAAKYWILAAVIAGFITQVALLSRIWIKRIRQMKETLNSFYP